MIYSDVFVGIIVILATNFLSNYLLYLLNLYIILMLEESRPISQKKKPSRIFFYKYMAIFSLLSFCIPLYWIFIILSLFDKKLMFYLWHHPFQFKLTCFFFFCPFFIFFFCVFLVLSLYIYVCESSLMPALCLIYHEQSLPPPPTNSSPKYFSV